MFEGLMKFLSEHGIDIQNCPGQSHDNVPAMNAKYNGLQAKVAARSNIYGFHSKGFPEYLRKRGFLQHHDPIDPMQ